MKRKVKLFLFRKKCSKYFPILFALFVVTGFVLFQKTAIFPNKNSYVCSLIKSVSYKDKKIYVQFSKPIPNKSEINKLFGYQAEVFNNPIVFTHESMNITMIDRKEMSFSIDLPFVQEYKGYFFCTSKIDEITAPSLKKQESVLHLADKIIPLNINKEDFDANSKMSQMKCFGTNIEKRFCEMKNVAFHKDLLFFATKALYTFPRPFLTTDSRTPPFNRKDTELNFEPIIVNESFAKKRFERVEEKSYLMTQVSKNNTIWNNVVEFIIPAYETFKEVEKTTKMTNRRIFIKDTEYKPNKELFKCLSNRDIEYLWNYKGRDIVFSDVVVGMKKLESNSLSRRSPDDFYKIKYTLNNKTVSEMKRNMFDILNIDEKIDEETPKVIIIENKLSGREITNIDEVEQYIRINCDVCDIQMIDLSDMSQKDVIQQMTTASVIVGMNSDDLINTIWMNGETKRSAVLEILPNRFNCSNHLQSVSSAAGVNYFSVMGADSNEASKSEEEKLLSKCRGDFLLCSTRECYNILQKQNIFVDIGDFSYVWDKIIELIRKK